MEVGDARRLILAHLAVRDEGAALDALERLLREHPEWNADPALLQLRGRTWIQFAKRCQDTLETTTLTRPLRQNAVRDLRSYLEKAERDLLASLDHGAAGAVRDHAKDDLQFIERLRRRARRG